jgi:hypothetical protein
MHLAFYSNKYGICGQPILLSKHPFQGVAFASASVLRKAQISDRDSTWESAPEKGIPQSYLKGNELSARREMKGGPEEGVADVWSGIAIAGYL